MTLGLRELVQLNAEVLVKMADAGEIRVKNCWVAVKGASKYCKAIASGDLRTNERSGSCSRACAACPSRTLRAVTLNGLEMQAGYCGTPFKEVGKGPTPTCGCLVTLTFAGDLHPAGKSLVNSEGCPQKKWPE